MHPRIRFSTTPLHLNLQFLRPSLRHASTLAPISVTPPPVIVDYGFASTSKLTIEQIRPSRPPIAIVKATALARSRPKNAPILTSSNKSKNSRVRFVNRLEMNSRQNTELLRRGGSTFWEKQRLLRREKSKVDRSTEDGVPKTELELMKLMQRLRRTSPPTAVSRIVEIHSHPSLVTITSSSTYAFVLRLAYRISNLSLARELLEEMEQRNIQKDAIICRAILYGCIKRGDSQGIAKIRQTLVERGWTEELGMEFWRERRDLGEQAIGIGDAWKSWGRSGWGTIKLTPPTMRKPALQQLKSVANTETQFLARPKILIPEKVKELDGQTVIRLVDSLVHERRATEAFSVVETWLDSNRPITNYQLDGANFPLTPSPLIAYVPPPLYIQLRRSVSPASIRTLSRTRNRARKMFSVKTVPAATVTTQQIDLYHSRSLFLMNILLKSLLMNYVPPFGCRSFILEFIARHSVQKDGIKPDIVTLRELLMNLRGRKNGFRRGIEVVDWFEEEFGTLPGSESSFTRRFLRRSRQLPSFTLAPILPSATEILPISRLSVRLSLILLNYAIHQHKFLTKGSRGKKIHQMEVSNWWTNTLVFKRRGTAEGRIDEEDWNSRSTLDLLRKARKCGLLE